MVAAAAWRYSVNPALEELIRDNRLEQLDDDLFRGRATHDSGQRIYGGQVLAQAISAAQQTVVSGQVLHSMHAYFLLMGDPGRPVIYDVERIRDGRSFATRRVVARQHGRAIFNCALSFQGEEAGFGHQRPMPDVADPAQLRSDAELYADFLPPGSDDYGWPLEFRQVDPIDPAAPQRRAPEARVWFRAAGALPDEPGVHQQLLAYASDNPILVSALRPHAVTHFSPGMMVVTLDHAIWFHAPFRIDDWLLYDIDSPFAGGGRGLAMGRIYDRGGRLVASVSQEGLIRQRQG